MEVQARHGNDAKNGPEEESDGEKEDDEEYSDVEFERNGNPEEDPLDTAIDMGMFSRIQTTDL